MGVDLNGNRRRDRGGGGGWEIQMGHNIQLDPRGTKKTP